MRGEIGSDFWLCTDSLTQSGQEGWIDLETVNLKGKDSVLLSAGRSAISYALRQIRKVKGEKKLCALVPPFTCETVLRPFLEAGLQIYVYDLDEAIFLHVDCLKAALDASNADVVLIHRYFGFDTADGIGGVIRDYRKKGVMFIEDRTQCLFSSFAPLPVDYIVGSLRKWAAIPDGGYCVAMDSKMEDMERLGDSDQELVKAKLHAFQLKYEYMEHGTEEKDAFLKAYGDAEHILNREKGFRRMSAESISIWNQLDIENLKDARRRNYQYVYDALQGCDRISLLTGNLGDGDIPLYLALMVESRKQLQEWLRDHDIYAPIVWPRPEAMPPVSSTVQRIYESAICLPIDQRYGLDDMERMVAAVKGFKGK